MQFNRTCPECGKLFFVGCDDWAFKRQIREHGDTHSKRIYYCSWGCYRKLEIREEKKRKHDKRKI